MHSDTTTVASPADGTALFVRTWLPEGTARAVVQIAHGMAEHSARYARFAEALTDAGFAVWANDHRGHGKTSTAARDRGYFADGDGWGVAVDDLEAVAGAARAAHPGLPLFFFGHSMGSMLGRDHASRHGDELAGAIFCGTAGDQGLLGKIGVRLAAAEARLRGRRAVSPLLDKLTFGSYNNAFKPARTRFDWLSRDPAEVDAYVADPRCGEVFTAGFFTDLIGGLNRLPGLAGRYRADLPMLFISGDRDPVGGNGKGVREAAEAVRAGGVTDLTCTLYPGARHELLNEVIRDRVTADVVAWLDAHL